MTEQERAAIAQTISTPGWEIIKQRAESCIRLAWDSLTLNDREDQVLELYHRAAAAKVVLYEFLRTIEAPETATPSDQLVGKEAEF